MIPIWSTIKFSGNTDKSIRQKIDFCLSAKHCKIYLAYNYCIQQPFNSGKKTTSNNTVTQYSAVLRQGKKIC